jgi:hypothetical protein
MCISSHVGPIIVGIFPQEKEAELEKLWGQQTSSVAETNLPLSKASPGAYSTYEMNIGSCFTYIYACVDCALRVGFLVDDVIDCMVVPFYMYPYFRSIYVYRLDVLCLVDRLR